MNAACPRCREQSSLHFRIGDLNQRISGEVFDYYRCPACAIVFMWPIPADLRKYYPDDYYSIPASAEELALIAERERYKVKIVQRFLSRGRLLEIGPAYGSFCYLAKQAGFDVDAIEMNEACCGFMKNILGIKTVYSTDPEAALHNVGLYDVIALWQVIEHLPNPWSLLRIIVQRLQPGGLLVLATPNLNSLQFRLLGRYWAHLDAPRHLELIPSGVLSAHMLKLGMNPLLITSADEESARHNSFGWETFFYNLSEKRAIRGGLHLFGKFLSMVLAPIEYFGDLGSTYTAVFRKDRQV